MRTQEQRDAESAAAHAKNAAVGTDRLIATDDRGITRVDAPCNHRRCPPGECIAYDEKTLEITEADVAMAAKLVAEGWWSTSGKYRTIAKWKEKPPTVEEIFSEDLLATFHGKRIAEMVRSHEKWHYTVGSPAHAEHIEHAKLTPSLFRAFKKAGGDCGR